MLEETAATVKLAAFLRQPWPWYVSGPLIGLTVPTLHLFAQRSVYGLVVGMVFGLVLVKTEAASWYHIQEMSRKNSSPPCHSLRKLTNNPTKNPPGQEGSLRYS